LIEFLADYAMVFFKVSKWDFTQKAVNKMKHEINLIEEITILMD